MTYSNLVRVAVNDLLVIFNSCHLVIIGGHVCTNGILQLSNFIMIRKGNFYGVQILPLDVFNQCHFQQFLVIRDSNICRYGLQAD